MKKKTDEGYYEKNKQVLKRYHSGVYDLMESTDPDPSLTVVPGKDGQKNLQMINKDGLPVLLHGPLGASDDIRQFDTIVPQDFSGVLILMGFGLGAPSLHLLRNRPGFRHFFIFERDPSVFRAALESNELMDLFADRRVVFSIGNEPDLNAVFKIAEKALQLENIQILRHGPSFANDSEYGVLSEAIYKKVNQMSAAGGTAKVLGKQFVLNRLHNMRRIRNDYLIDSVSDRFRDTPAVLVAGGPSLDKNIHLLPRVKGRALIFAVDSVVPALLDRGIVPDFIASIDPQPITYEKFRGSKVIDSGLNLICSAWVSTRVVSNFPSDKLFWTFGGRNIENWLNKILGGKIFLIGASTVAHMNLHAAMIMGCSPIVFVGQDLAYSEEKDHASRIALRDSTKMEKIVQSSNDSLWVDGYYGGKVRTSRAFVNYKTVFEDIIRSNAHLRFVNATEGGVIIEGTENAALELLADQWESQCLEFDQSVLENVTPMGDEAVASLDRGLEELLDTGRALMEKIAVTDALVEGLLKGAGRLKKRVLKDGTISDLPGKLQKNIQKIETLSAAIDNPGIFWHLLDELTMKGLKESERLLHEIQADPSIKKGSVQWIIKQVERVNYINSVRKEIWDWLEPEIKSVIQFHETEKQLVKGLDEPSTSFARLLELCRFYHDWGYTALSAKYLTKMEKDGEADPDICFMIGVALAKASGMDQAESYFEKAVRLNPGIVPKIDVFLKESADEYLSFGSKWEKNDLNTSRRFFIKGLCFMPDHPVLKQRLMGSAKRDLKTIHRYLEESELKKADPLLENWLNDIRDYPFLEEIIGKETVADFHDLSGTKSMHAQEFAAAISFFENAIALAPHRTDYYVHLTDVSFAVGEFDKGVLALQKAVELDRGNARYWEMIGDTLFNDGNFQDALAAWKECLTALPDRIDILRKMSEAYRRLGSNEAADEAMRHYHLRKGDGER